MVLLHPERRLRGHQLADATAEGGAGRRPYLGGTARLLETVRDQGGAGPAATRGSTLWLSRADVLADSVESTPETNVNIRAFDTADWEAICDVYEPAAIQEIASSGADAKTFRPLPDEEDLDKFVRLNSALVAWVDTRIVGFVAWRDRGEWRDSGYLSWLYVDPGFHRRGIGNELLKEAMAALGPQAWTLVRLGNDPAISLYKEHGMEIVISRSPEKTEARCWTLSGM